MKTKGRKRKITTIVLVALLLMGLLVFMFSGKNFQIVKGIFDPKVSSDDLMVLLQDLGWRGYITIALLSMLQVVASFLPAEPTQVVSGICFGFWKGTLICFIGVLLGNTIIYLMYKLLGNKIGKYFEKNLDIDFDLACKSPKIALIVFILYFLPAIPYGLICFFSASIGFKYPRYIILTGLGSLPSVFIGVGLGHAAVASTWILTLCIFVVIVALLIVVYIKKDAIFRKVNHMIAKSHAHFSSAVSVKKYNPTLFNIFNAFVVPTQKRKVRYRLNNKVKGRLEKPCIVLCNHGAFTDFIYAGNLLRKERPHFVVARYFFFKKFNKRILKAVGCIPKSMYTPDLENVRNCLRVIQQGGVLAMMPEARLSTVGKYEGIQDATFKFIQRMNVTVYALTINGNYLSKPKWGDKARKGARVEATFQKLFDKGELKTLDIEEVKSRIDNALYYDEFAWLETRPDIKYKHKNIAKGLENILTLCPKCGAHYSLTTDKNTISCSKCDLVATVNDRYAFNGAHPFENFAKWYEWQENEMRKQIQADENWSMSSPVTLKHSSFNGKKTLRVAGSGVCTLSRDGLVYEGTQDGITIKKTFPLAVIHRILFGAGEDFEVYEGNEIYYFVPEIPASSIDWYTASALLQE